MNRVGILLFLTLLRDVYTAGLSNHWNVSTTTNSQIFHIIDVEDSTPQQVKSFVPRILLRKRDVRGTKWERVSSTAQPRSTTMGQASASSSFHSINISAQAGTTAYLPCSVKNIENKTVSWIRSRDSHILTVDRYIFIADERFQAWHQQNSDTWTLMVKFVQERDEGRYECQVSTEPKTSSFIYFHVVSPIVEITGGTDIYVKVGSPVSLMCVISEALLEPKYIFWYQDGKRVVSDNRKDTEMSLTHLPNRTTIGKLDIAKVALIDEGTYYCAPEKLSPAKVMLHVINGEHPAAMQHGTSVMVSSATPELLILLVFLLCFNKIYSVISKLL